MNASAGSELVDLSGATAIKKGQQFACFFMSAFLLRHVHPRSLHAAKLAVKRRGDPECFEYGRCYLPPAEMQREYARAEQREQPELVIENFCFRIINTLSDPSSKGASSCLSRDQSLKRVWTKAAV